MLSHKSTLMTYIDTVPTASSIIIEYGPNYKPAGYKYVYVYKQTTYNMTNDPPHQLSVNVGDTIDVIAKRTESFVEPVSGEWLLNSNSYGCSITFISAGIREYVSRITVTSENAYASVYLI